MYESKSWCSLPQRISQGGEYKDEIRPSLLQQFSLLYFFHTLKKKNLNGKLTESW